MTRAPRSLVIAALALAVACGRGAAPPPPTEPGQPPAATGCEGARAHVEALYRAEAQAQEPGRVEAAVADNTAMALGDCARDPALAACFARAASAADLERTCLPAPDDEGTEGDQLAAPAAATPR